MATTEIHAITQTVARSLAYIMSDKKEEKPKDDIADSIAYITNDKTGEVIYQTLTSTLNCTSPENPVSDFYDLMYTYGRSEIENGSNRTKDGKAILAWHLIQSFDAQIDPVMANEIGVKLAEELFPNHPVVISTHTNTEHTHNHIEFCAWNFDGKKYHCDHAAYRLIRETSDRLCEEYGLNVLEHTRQQKLISWTDDDGRTRYYEPTERKEELRRQREEGKIKHDDVNSYRNSPQYKEHIEKKLTNVEIVKTAIDNLLPVANSYDHLLFMLREQGFIIKDKKKNGDWLKHITFIPPSAEKGVRDSSIGEDGYYIRENLEEVIRERIYAREMEMQRDAHPEIPYFENYDYGTFDAQTLNEEYRKVKNEDGSFHVKKRGEPEKDVIRDIKEKDRELKKSFDTSRLERIAREVKAENKKGNRTMSRDDYLLTEVRSRFNNLRFMEEKQIYSYSQINEVVAGLYVQQNACQNKIFEAELMLRKLEDIVATPQKAKALVEKMEKNEATNPYYHLESRAADVKRAMEYEEIIIRYNLFDESGVAAMTERIQNYQNQIDRLKLNLHFLSNELSLYDSCVDSLRKIDRDLGIGRNEFFSEYIQIKRAGQFNQAAQPNAPGRESQKRQKDRER